ncbi:MAG: right-handed parallel beta-helix repeat-containing protein, partial [Prevotellaceae bacterium]|nr:right-handed parallel beta-helix repeat-containing protein [Prevotellaceae bacterium]
MRKKNFLLIVLAMVFTITQAQNVYYVDANVASSGNGSTWNDAFKTLEEAISSTTTATTVDVIFVKKGTYTAPSDYGLGYFFDQKKNVTVYGNCEGTETLSSLPVVDETTVLATVLKAPKDAQNAYTSRVLTIYKGSVTLIGFDIEGGDGSKESHSNDYGNGKYGGGVFIMGQGKLMYCNIHGATSPSGAGAYLKKNNAEKPVLEYCEIYDNYTATGDESGGGIYTADNTSIKNCIIRNNSAKVGGGIYLNGGAAPAAETIVSNSVIKN